MADHPDRSPPQPYSSYSQRLPPKQPPLHHHHHHLQQQPPQPQGQSQGQSHHPHPAHSASRSYYYPPPSHTYRAYQSSQDIQGPLSAGVIEGHRAFPSFHGSLHHPRQSSSSSTASSSAPMSYPNLSVAEILDRYQDAHKDFLVSILNAKAKEDERRAEEERHKTEQIRLQSKQLELDLAMEKRRGSPPAGNSENAGSHYTSPPNSYGSRYAPYPQSSSSSSMEASRSTYDRHTHHDHPHSVHGTQEPQEYPPPTQVKHATPPEQPPLPPTPQGRPPSLKINTALRHNFPKRHGTSPHHITSAPILPGSSSNKHGRHFPLPVISASAQSSPVAALDYQSHIPPPLTPKDDHGSPTSAVSPAAHNMKRKSIHHDAVMDAVRAKVLRNAAANQSNHNQPPPPQQQQPHRKPSGDSLKRKTSAPHGSSPERPKRQADNSPYSRPVSATTPSGPKSRSSTESRSNGHSGLLEAKLEAKLEGPLLSTLSHSVSPQSPSPPNSAGAMDSGRSRSSSPTERSTGKDLLKENKMVRYELERPRVERQNEVG
ncbi:hypothetical protein BGW38_005884, partial [Lunasporangiospora selenospora]